MFPAADYENIYIIGAQSTGKTTLVHALEKYFVANADTINSSKITRPIIIREVARKVLETHKFTRDDIVRSPSRALELQKLILSAQLETEKAVLRATGAWYISDRSGLDPIVYAKHFVGDDAAMELMSSVDWKSLHQNMRESLVILCEAGCTWLVDDGTRLMPKDETDWLRLDSIFRELLGALEIPVIVISKDLDHIEDRVQVVLDAFGYNR